MNADYLISNQTYRFLKLVVTIVLPGLGALYANLTAVWDAPNPVPVLGALATLALLGGLLMAASNATWNKSESKYDGELITTGNDPDTGIPELALNITTDPRMFAAKDSILFKSVDSRPKQSL